MKKILFILFLLCFIVQGAYVEAESESQISEELIDMSDKTRHVWLGVKFTDYTYRPYIIEVFSGSAAEKSWFKEWDLVIEVNGKKIFTNQWPFIEWREWDDFSVTVLRDTKKFLLKGKLWEFFTEEYLWSHNSGIEETRTIVLKASTYLNEYEIVNYNQDYKYVLLISKMDKVGNFTEMLDGTLKIWEWIIKKEINSSIFVVEAADLSSTYEWEYNWFRAELFLEIEGEFYYGSESEDYWYFALNRGYKKEEIKEKIRKYDWSETVEKARIENILLQYKEKVWDEKFEEKMWELYEAINARMNDIVDKITSEEDIIKYSEALSRLLQIEEVLFNQEGFFDKLVDEIEVDMTDALNEKISTE